MNLIVRPNLCIIFKIILYYFILSRVHLANEDHEMPLKAQELFYYLITPVTDEDLEGLKPPQNLVSGL